MLNYLPIAGQAIQLVAELLFSGFSDYLGTRLPFLLLHSVSISGEQSRAAPMILIYIF